MPIDLRRLCQNQEDKAYDDAFRESLQARWTSSEAATADAPMFALLQSVIDLKQRQNDAYSDRNRYVAKVRKGEKPRDKKHLQQLEDRLNESQRNLEKAHFKVPNMLDLGASLMEQKDGLESAARKTRLNSEVPNDPLFCLGGYELIGDACILTDVGLELMAALQGLASDHFQVAVQEVAATVQRWELPSTMSLPSTQYHSTLGCCGVGCPACQIDVVMCPSWMQLLSHGGNTYWDRNLPNIHLSTVSNNDSLTVDGREKARLESFHQKSRAWHQRLATPCRSLQVLALTGPLLEVDARPVQRQIIESILSFYRRLVPTGTSLGVRSVASSELGHAEASRLVVESTLPGGRIVCLAFLSNFLDYASTGLRHGTTKQELIVLQGVLCSFPETLEWMMQMNTNAKSVTLPLSIQEYGQIAGELLYRRRIVVNKNGKRNVLNIRVDENNQSDSTPRTPGGATPNDIRGEALSCPFDFLPFYYR